MDFLSRFIEYIKINQLCSKSGRLVLAVSGGVDSVVLCELCHQAGYDFVIAHCNFSLRGTESDSDEKFVSELGKKYGVEVFVKKFETARLAAEQKQGIQETARELRYAWFAGLATDLQYQKSTAIQQITTVKGKGRKWKGDPGSVYILTAHHANDNIETLLMNFFKGTGINGLQGIQKRMNYLSQPVIRPLLFAKKNEIIMFAKTCNLPWREDASNDDGKYSRNYLRHELIPALQVKYPQVEDNLMDNLTRFSDIQELYSLAIDSVKQKLVEMKGNEMQMAIYKLLKTPALPTVLYEILKGFGFLPGQVPEVVKLLESESGKRVESGSHRVFRNRNWLVLGPLLNTGNSHYLVDSTDRKVMFGRQELLIIHHTEPEKIDTDDNVAQVDASGIKFPLLLRKWRNGDYFYPLGMEKKKKLSRFFTDRKLSLSEKENTWVLESGKKIIWVLGQRIDNRFRITEHSKKTIRFSLRSAQ
jgi:tRNA(Ile)-lysidine synthase